jgi:hypothetical protein
MNSNGTHLYFLSLNYYHISSDRHYPYSLYCRHQHNIFCPFHSQVFPLHTHHCIPLNSSKSSSYWPDPSSGTIQALSETLDFDVELFAAYTLDWQERVLVIGETASSIISDPLLSSPILTSSLVFSYPIRSSHSAMQCLTLCC